VDLRALAGLPLILGVSGAWAQNGPEVKVSTPSPVSQEEENPFSFELVPYESGSQWKLTFRMRFDERDAEGFAPGLVRRMMDPIGSLFWLGNRLTLGSIFRFYGVTVRPGDILSESSEEGAGDGAAPGASPSGAEAAPSGSPGDASPKRRFSRPRIDFKPLIQDLRQDLRRGVLIQGLELAFPQTRMLDFEDKRAMLEGIILIEKQSDIPLFSLPADGAEYLLKISSEPGR